MAYINKSSWYKAYKAKIKKLKNLKTYTIMALPTGKKPIRTR